MYTDAVYMFCIVFKVRFLADLVNCHVVLPISLIELFEKFVGASMESDVTQVSFIDRGSFNTINVQINQGPDTWSNFPCNIACNSCRSTCRICNHASCDTAKNICCVQHCKKSCIVCLDLWYFWFGLFVVGFSSILIVAGSHWHLCLQCFVSLTMGMYV